MTIAGCCKGSGMIAPNMATMLAYVATDAAIAAPLLQGLSATWPIKPSTASLSINTLPLPIPSPCWPTASLATA